MFTEKRLFHDFFLNRTVKLGKVNNNHHYIRNAGNINNSFDIARRTQLAETYFGFEKDPSTFSTKLFDHTKTPEEANVLKVYNSVNKSISRLHNLKECNSIKTPLNCTSYKKSILKDCITKPNIAASKVLIRFSSTKRNRNIRKSIEEKSNNKLLQSLYNTNLIQVYGKKAEKKKAFDCMLSGSKEFTVSIETSANSWIDQNNIQPTFNYESASFNIVNHTKQRNVSISGLLKDNPRACHRVKAITEYSDLTRVNAIRLNTKYNDSMCFNKLNSLCAAKCDLRKTYGPFFPLFKK